ncbi:SLAP domain-containing protein [Lactobacillus sp. ESL0791]|uniref:SLAP domain-containing protein n=1 Tax=Lactobacillus sp. ESL0791 TaxID=2983234 RepID=UPI0023F8363F|nr:SLAP domain-containing protein [Lactobacillus sp. ESL0791]MDF7638306.1 SLAP domain-containing protein [Lactobacillus sp. ESL0791]
MKKKRKLIMLSVAALLAIDPVITITKNVGVTVQAADDKKTSAKGTIKLNRNAYVYDKNGKRLSTYMGSKENTLIGKGVSLKYAEPPVSIDGTSFYNIGGGAYVKVANVGYVDGKAFNYKAATAKLKRNSYIYDGDGDTTKQVLKKKLTISVDQLKYIGNNLYYRIADQKNQFVKANNVGSVSKKLKPVNSKPVTIAVATLTHNAYIYDGNGKSLNKKIAKNKQVTVDQLKYIDSKLYYRIKDKNYPGDDQWIKKNNIGVVTGDKIEPINNKPVVDPKTTVVTLGNKANVYSDKGSKQKINTLAKGTQTRVTELRYIWLPNKNEADLFYKMANNKNGYLRDIDISDVQGVRLVPVNTQEEAKNDVTIATTADKQPLQVALDHGNDVKKSDAYLLSAKSLQEPFDTALTAANSANIGANTTLSDIKQAIDNLNEAEKALDGKKIQVADLNNLTVDEANQIIKLAAAVNGVDASAVKFTNNNSNLTITNANGFAKDLNVADYAVAKQ